MTNFDTIAKQRFVFSPFFPPLQKKWGFFFSSIYSPTLSLYIHIIYIILTLCHTDLPFSPLLFVYFHMWIYIIFHMWFYLCIPHSLHTCMHAHTRLSLFHLKKKKYIFFSLLINLFNWILKIYVRKLQSNAVKSCMNSEELNFNVSICWIWCIKIA